MKQQYIDIEEIPVRDNNEGFSLKHWSRRMLRNWQSEKQLVSA